MIVRKTFALSDDHREFLHRCAISDEVIDGRPYYSLTPQSCVHLGARWGLSHEALRGEGIVIPRYCPYGDETYPQIRYTPPRKDGQKYTCPVGSGGVVDVHPGVTSRVRDTSEALIFAESIKGADALHSAGILAAGFHGVWGWKVDGGASLELTKIPLKGREVGICFDVDVHHRQDLQKALKEFWRTLQLLGATVHVLVLPAVVGEKAGIDDYLAIQAAAGGA